jgi:hypothetical protein
MNKTRKQKTGARRDDNGGAQTGGDSEYEEAMKHQRMMFGVSDEESLKTPPPENPTAKEPLRGSYFHSIVEGELEWQGVIIRQFGDYVLVQVFSWVDGAICCRQLLRLEDLVWNRKTNTGFYLYGDHYSFWWSGERGVAKVASNKQ